jgi:hypothetical protein
MKKKFLGLLSAFFLVSAEIRAEDSADSAEPLPYSPDEFPQWSKDLRRLEIVSLGSVPFVALSVTLGYGTYQYFSGKTDTFPNPFDKSGSFGEGEQMKIFFASLGAGAFIGISDFFINIIKRSREKKILSSRSQIVVTPRGEEDEEPEQEK